MPQSRQNKTVHLRPHQKEVKFQVQFLKRNPRKFPHWSFFHNFSPPIPRKFYRILPLYFTKFIPFLQKIFIFPRIPTILAHSKNKKHLVNYNGKWSDVGNDNLSVRLSESCTIAYIKHFQPYPTRESNTQHFLQMIRSSGYVLVLYCKCKNFKTTFPFVSNDAKKQI